MTLNVFPQYLFAIKLTSGKIIEPVALQDNNWYLIDTDPEGYRFLPVDIGNDPVNEIALISNSARPTKYLPPRFR